MALDERVNHLKECTSEHLTCVLQHVKELSSLVSNTLHLTSLNKTNGSVNPIEKELEQSMKQMGVVLVETKNLKSRVDQQDSRIKSLETVKNQSTLSVNSSCGQKNELQEATRRMHNQEAKVADLEVFLIEGNNVNEDLERQVNVLKIEQDGYKETIRKLQRHVESLEHTLSLRNVVLADLEEQVKQTEISNYNGVLLWKISDFARKRQDAVTGRQVSFYSPCFYSSSYGYKMCVRLYLNGDGMGRGTHISVFFVVMRGQYDALLRWPFRQKVTFMLLDQDNVEHVIDAFRPDPTSNSFQRPKREMNIASGCPTFCPLSELNNYAYVRDDTMFLKIMIDTADI